MQAVSMRMFACSGPSVTLPFFFTSLLGLPAVVTISLALGVQVRYCLGGPVCTQHDHAHHCRSSAAHGEQESNNSGDACRRDAGLCHCDLHGQNRYLRYPTRAHSPLQYFHLMAAHAAGTLTKNEMTVVAIRTARGALRVTGSGYSPEDGHIMEHEEQPLSGAPSYPHTLTSFPMHSHYRRPPTAPHAAFTSL
jgi:hypothetical protein